MDVTVISIINLIGSHLFAYYSNKGTNRYVPKVILIFQMTLKYWQIRESISVVFATCKLNFIWPQIIRG